jgi:hypothetical protein
MSHADFFVTVVLGQATKTCLMKSQLFFFLLILPTIVLSQNCLEYRGSLMKVTVTGKDGKPFSMGDREQAYRIILNTAKKKILVQSDVDDQSQNEMFAIIKTEVKDGQTRYYCTLSFEDGGKEEYVVQFGNERIIFESKKGMKEEYFNTHPEYWKKDLGF